MKSLREMFGRTGSTPAPTAEPVDATPWNTLSTLGAGSIADVDNRGAIFPRNRPVSVEVWFGAGDRWLQGGVADGVRQSRIVGLPILETRQRIGDSDIVQTAWADEAGDAQGRVVVDLRNETDVAVVAAVVVRPYTLLEAGRASELRVADTKIVVDKLPLVDLGRVPGDVVTARDDDRETSALLARLALDAETLAGDQAISDADGRASIAALIPLTPGIDRQIQILDGREASTVAPAPIENVVAGWRTHLRDAAEIELPAWPKHIPVSLMSSLLGFAADRGAPLGDEHWRRGDDTLLVAALAGVGLEWAAANVADRVLDEVTEGVTSRNDWPAVAAACGAIAGTSFGDEVLARHGEAVAAVAGHTLSSARAIAAVQPILRAVASAHGAEAAADASSITGALTRSADGVVLTRHGIPCPADSARDIEELLARAGKPFDAETIGLAMIASANIEREYEPLVPLRSLAGSTWRWPRNGSGDSAHARAALLIGLRALCISEYPGGPAEDTVTADSPADIDVFPGINSAWLGQNMAFKRLPTSAGKLSVALRWHGERPALLWEMTEHDGRPFTIGASHIDPLFSTGDLSGEALLAAPTHLAPKKKASLL